MHIADLVCHLLPQFAMPSADSLPFCAVMSVFVCCQ